MFREMRRKKQLLSMEESVQVLQNGTSGVLAVVGDEGYPYAVPLSYIYDDGKIYFHGAKTGHKVDAIKNNEKVSFCVVNQDKIVPEEYTTYYRSVIVFGKAYIMEDMGEIKAAIEKLALRYSPNGSRHKQVIEDNISGMSMFVIEIEHMTGKASMGLVKQTN